tara:strand:+ start:205 stop:513 length:309 start_codon:yes stop_codon:yes gene_type:complete
MGQPQTPQITEETISIWKHLAEKKNWRIVQLPNGYFQTEYKDPNCKCEDCKCEDKNACCDKWFDVTRRETLKSAEAAIDGSVQHYKKKVDFLQGPKVVKTFK